MKRIQGGLCVLAAALPGLALAQASPLLPSVPVGGELQVTLSLTSFGVSPLPGIPISLAVPAACGTFRGAESTIATTDGAGSFSFVFTPNDTPGICTIVGSYGSYSAAVRTTVYRPSEIVLKMNDALDRVPAAFTEGGFSGTITARGLPIWGFPFSVEGPYAMGAATGTLSDAARQGTSNANGGIGFIVQGNGVPGVYDFVLHAGSETRKLRVWQQAATPADDPPGRSLRARDPLSSLHGTTRLSIVDGPASCELAGVDRFVAIPPFAAGIDDFPMGMLQMIIDGCPVGSTVKLRVDYAVALPANGVVYGNAGGTPPWQALPGTVSGSSASFTVVDNGLGDRADTPRNIFNVFGVGTRASAPRAQAAAVHDLWWAGNTENGWGMSLAQTADGNNLFAGIYAYDAAGNPTWWVMSGGFWDYERHIFEGELASPFGTPWYDYDATLLAYEAVGQVRLTVDGPNALSLDYFIGADSGSRSLQRQPFGADESSPIPDASGMWWGGAPQSGWGVAVTQHHATLFCVWYTYDASNRPTWFVLPGGRWTSSSTYEGRIYRTHGSPWLGQASYDASKLTVTDVGPYRLRFDGTSATLDYTVDGRSGSLALTRQAPF